jgi:tellurite resistance protein
MAARTATLLAMAKMALVDGEVSDAERRLLEPLLTAGESLDVLLEAAKQRSLPELVQSIDRYADRFFIALRAASMAAIDERLDAREEALFAELVALLEIEPADRALIERSVAALSAVDPPPLDPRIEQLYQQSSFV